MIEKLKYLVIEICRTKKDFAVVNIIENSILVSRNRGSDFRWAPDSIELLFLTNPDIYIKYADEIDRITGIIDYYFNQVRDPESVIISKTSIQPNYEKISILKTEVSLIQTPWEEINSLQKKIIEDMKGANSSIDFQNIGNTSRTIMDKLARIVFNKEIHIAPIDVDISNGKFKNQLHTYISTVLKGSSNEKLRHFSESSIIFMEKSIDLMNTTTHKLDVQKHFAEVCVISTISVISLIKAIFELS